MLKGFMPTAMEDKWMVITDTPDAQGNTVVHAYHGWAAHEQFSLTIAAGNPNETEVKNWATIPKISWKVQPGRQEVQVSEKEAKQRAVDLCKGLLHCDLENA
ncbi:hypothetical protein K504DRAFT_517053 [Pleomassaria siparia CBS 279.74]|uniref:Uncharacterized protein n=1 Tax=Pleomassaria siparia CBS 279.74 TaxID=1314801 RepID=A0A6G1KL61_9PLEO|nr:hypothetical protein K504DRAFT_517053 [Pleomassaria siparia CBS 279.74]